MMRIALEVYGVEPWQCRVFMNGEPWKNVVTSWTINCGNMTEPALTLALHYEMPARFSKPSLPVGQIAGFVTSVEPRDGCLRIEAVVPMDGTPLR